MIKPRSKIPIVVGVIASVAVHSTLLVPLLVISMTAKPAELRERTARFDPDAFEEPAAPPPEDRQMLGLDDPEESPSTFTWIGYDEYEEHIAALSDVEQAAFSENPTGAEPTPPSEAVPEAAPTEPTDPAQPAEAVAQTDPPITEAQPIEEPTASAGPTDAVTDSPQPTSPELIPMRNFLVSPDFALAMAELQGPPMPAEGQEQKEATGLDGTRAGESLPTENPPAETPEKSDKGEPAKPTENKPAQEPSEPKEQTDPKPAGDPADQADMESDPTSIIDAAPENWKVGKPLAAHGLELKPRRPNFTTLQSLTSAPGNPLVEIRFGRDGKPKDARILQTSGDRASDTSIRASLYRWCASGKQLEELKGDETINIRIRILLHRPRRR